MTAAMPASASVGSSLEFSGAVVIKPRKFTGLPVPAAIPASTREVYGSPAIAAAPANATVGSFVGFSDAVMSPVQAVIPASTRGVSGLPVTAAAPASATVGSFVGFFGAVVTDWRMGVVTHIPKAGDVNADASYNSFSPLSGLGSGEDLR